PLSDLEAKLPEGLFVRTHRSYIIQLSCMQSVDLQNMTVMIKDKVVPLSKGFRDNVLQKLKLI
ncbi:MAG: LytTR family transcriptional regulator, partial [Saprospiraceae bacterium]|nr:LytTR family transcriptional regulator [Saprospiraceae bacterium]